MLFLASFDVRFGFARGLGQDENDHDDNEALHAHGAVREHGGQNVRARGG